MNRCGDGDHQNWQTVKSRITLHSLMCTSDKSSSGVVRGGGVERCGRGEVGYGVGFVVGCV